MNLVKRVAMEHAGRKILEGAVGVKNSKNVLVMLVVVRHIIVEFAVVWVLVTIVDAIGVPLLAAVAPLRPAIR